VTLFDNPVLLTFLAAIMLPVWAAILGRWRLSNMQDELDPDWQELVAFGAALRAFTQSAGHDAKALTAMVTLAPDIEPLVFGAHAPPHRAVPPGIEPYPPPAALESSAPAAPMIGAPRQLLFAHLETLPQAFGDPAQEAVATEKSRLEDLRGQVLGAEWLLQTEMKKLSQKDTDVNAWVWLGVSGALLFLVGRGGGRTAAQRTQRRTLELDPRFETLVRVAIVILFAGSFALAFRSAGAVLARMIQMTSHSPGR
jgi:hypothetical protein